MNKKFRVAIFASGNGTNAEAIIKHFQHHLSITIALVLSNNKEANVLVRAAKLNVPTFTFNKLEFKDSVRVLSKLQTQEITHIVLAGFMWLVPSYLVMAYPTKIINIHPALLPKYGGKGMYGASVHEAVKTNNESMTGITIHLVNEHYDEGKILLQKSCHVLPSDSPEDIANKVHTLEHEWYPRQIEEWIVGSDT
jgi:phosphoribosylglycinamide formyltransferase 1